MHRERALALGSLLLLCGGVISSQEKEKSRMDQSEYHECFCRTLTVLLTVMNATWSPDFGDLS